MDVALAWADPRVIDVVQTKWESMPAPGDKKGKGGKGGKGKGGSKTARPASGPAGEKENQVPASQVGSYYFVNKLHVLLMLWCNNWDISASNKKNIFEQFDGLILI